MKKKGFVEKLITAGIAIAGIGGTLYLLKDKIEENPKYKESIDKLKDKIKKQEEPNISPEDFEMADDLDDVEDFEEILHESSDRGYVTIKLHNEADYEEAAMEAVSDYSEEE